jgi:hypothetical protein
MMSDNSIFHGFRVGVQTKNVPTSCMFRVLQESMNYFSVLTLENTFIQFRSRPILTSTIMQTQVFFGPNFVPFRTSYLPHLFFIGTKAQSSI